MSALDDFRFWMQTFEDSRRTIVCPPGLGDQVRAIAHQYGVGGQYDVQESSFCSDPRRILVIDHNAIDASTRQAIQRIGKGPLWTRHAHGIDCCWDCYDGRRVHPLRDDDPTCQDRADERGRCTYAAGSPA